MITWTIPLGARALLAALILLTGVLPAASPAAVVAAAPTVAPGSLSPAGGATVNANPILTWGAVAGAVKYRVQLSTAPDFSVTTYSVDTQERRATPTADLPLGTLYWRVAGMDASNALGPWADTQFTKAWDKAPAPQYPPDLATLAFPTSALRFTWGALPGAQSYELQVGNARELTIATSYLTKNTSFVITEPRTSGQAFFWKVRGVSATTGVASNWSETRQATPSWTGTPILIYPADGATVDIKDGDLYFDWNPLLGARTYRLQVSPNDTFDNNVTIDVIVKGTRYAPPSTLNNGSYYWRVRALDAAGPQNLGTWSAARLFQRGWSTRPTLLAPSNGNITLSAPTFTWTPVDHGGWYQVQISTDINFAAPNSVTDSAQTKNCFTNRTTFTPYVRISGTSIVEPGSCNVFPIPGLTYYWHVRGIDAPVLNPGVEYSAGVLGLWSNTSISDVYSFVYRPSVPAYVSPADGATVDVPTLNWADAPGATKYKVTILKSTGAVAASSDTYSTSWTPTSALTSTEGPFRWYVQAYDGNGQLSLIPAQVNQRTFTLTAIATSYLTPDPVSPADAGASFDMPSLTWQPVTGAATYQVIYGVQGSAVEAPLGPRTAYPAFTYPTSVFSSGTYFWYVRAYGASAEIADSFASKRTFVISQLDLLAPTDYLTPAPCTPQPSCTPTLVKDTATLIWNAVPGASGYTVYVAFDPNFTNVYRTYTTTFTRLSPRDSWLDNQANQAYYWFVRPARSGNTGRFDSVAQATAAQYQKRSEGIHLLAPAIGAPPVEEVTFSWEDFLATNQGLGAAVTQEARQYRIQVSTVADFATTLDTKVIDQTSFTAYDRTYPEGPLYWRVQAIDGSGNSLTWSAARTLTKASPRVSLASPGAGATVTGVPYFQWTAQAFAATYDIQIAKNGDTNFSGANQVVLANTKMSAYAYTEALPAGDYAWRVRRRDADNLPGPWSWSPPLPVPAPTPSSTIARVFRLVPTSPALLQPVNGAKVNAAGLPTFLLQWSSTQPYPKYIVETSTTSNFSIIKETRSTVMTSWAPTVLYGNGTYWWRVKALNAAGTVVATSGVWTFTVDGTAPTAVSMAPATAAPITGAFTVTFSEAVKNVSGTTFKAIIAGTATIVPGTVTPASTVNTTTAVFTPTAVLVPGQSYTLSVTSGITDLAGNPLVARSFTVRTSLTVENGSPALRDTWARIASTSASGGGYAAARQAGAKQTFTFTGTSVSIVGRRAANGGLADVYLDGVKKTVTPISFYNAATQWKVTVYSVTGLTAARHTLELRALGTKAAASTGTWVYLDSFVGAGVTNEETAPTIVGRFPIVTNASASGGSYDTTARAYGEAGNAQYSLTFKGTGVIVYATKTATSGAVSIYIDGVLKTATPLSLYSATTAYQQAVWTSAALTNATHTVVVKVVGATASGSTRVNVGIDKLVVK